jgi:hypothetical protein
VGRTTSAKYFRSECHLTPIFSVPYGKRIAFRACCMRLMWLKLPALSLVKGILMNASNWINCVLFLAVSLGGIQGANAFESVVCVTTPAEFQTALTNAETASLATVIEVTAGVYSIDTTLIYNGTTSSALTIEGGYSGSLVHGLCSAQTTDPSLTVLDGGGSQIIMNLSSGSAPITVEYLTFQHGFTDATTLESPALSVGFQNTGAFNIANNIFTANTAQTDGLDVISLNNVGDLSFLNNAIVNNTSTTGSILGVLAYGSGTLAVNNNTISGNSCSALMGSDSLPGDGTNLAIYGSPVNVDNNIFYGNVGCTNDIHFNAATASARFYVEHNDIGVEQLAITGTYSPFHNLSLAPDFVGNGNYKLAPSSPLVNQGDNFATGGIGSVDAAGNPRVVYDTVDIGAYELQDDIFKNGFE